MKKFLWSTLILTLLSYVVQYAMDIIAPLDDTATPSLNLSSVTSIDDLANNPALLDALQTQTLNTDSLNRMIWAAVIATLLMMLWPVLRTLVRRLTLSRRGLHWHDTKRFLVVTTPDDILLASKNSAVVTQFVYRGTNTADQAMTRVSGAITFAKSKERYALAIDRQPVMPTSTIPPLSDFILTADLPHLPAKHLLQRHGAFTLTFQYNGHIYSEHFNAERIGKLIKQRLRDL